MQTKYFSGDRFGRLVTIERVYRQNANGKKKCFWRCQCDCGTETTVLSTNLYGGITKSCGCLRKDASVARERRKNPPWRGVLRYYKRNASIRGITWELEDAEFEYLIRQSCFYCGAAPTQRQVGFDAFNGIDRLNNEISYRFETCVPCCATCNWAKSRMGQQEFYEWVARVHHHLAERGDA